MRSSSKTPLVTLGPALLITGLGVAAGLALTGCSGSASTTEVMTGANLAMAPQRR